MPSSTILHKTTRISVIPAGGLVLFLSLSFFSWFYGKHMHKPKFPREQNQDLLGFEYSVETKTNTGHDRSSLKF